MSPAIAEPLPEMLTDQEMVEKDRNTTLTGSGTLAGRAGGWPAWLGNADEDLIRLLRLPHNWDSYGAIQVSKENAIAALNLLINVVEERTPKPAFIPTNQGSVQLEWHTGGIDLEIEILSPHRFFLSFENSNTGETLEKEITAMNISPIVDCLGTLIGH